MDPKEVLKSDIRCSVAWCSSPVNLLTDTTTVSHLLPCFQEHLQCYQLTVASMNTPFLDIYIFMLSCEGKDGKRNMFCFAFQFGDQMP
ncbi:hypothetical protein AV530_011935 [Patagioenas fasciata monilis]|uniref:Uncharacterized protein n=1 Tax=Patagioenas fasciata monilis TaxID=372326 RepID=A0A1V4JUB8_PATFA|nr:hypothetical protein AV530_011935 [Patagioenas fasciata monilis]